MRIYLMLKRPETTLLYSYQPRELTPADLIEQEEIKRKIHEEFYLNKIDNSNQIRDAMIEDEIEYHKLNSYEKSKLRGESHQMVVELMKQNEPKEPDFSNLPTHRNPAIRELVNEIRVDKQKIINKMIDDKSVKTKPKSKK